MTALRRFHGCRPQNGEEPFPFCRFLNVSDLEFVTITLFQSFRRECHSKFHPFRKIQDFNPLYAFRSNAERLRGLGAGITKKGNY